MKPVFTASAVSCVIKDLNFYSIQYVNVFITQLFVMKQYFVYDFFSSPSILTCSIRSYKNLFRPQCFEAWWLEAFMKVKIVKTMKIISQTTYHLYLNEIVLLLSLLNS